MGRKRRSPAGPPSGPPSGFKAGGAPTGPDPALDDFGKLFERVHRRALGRAGKHLDPDHADDAVADAAGKLLELWPTLAPGKKTERYFLRAVQNRARDGKRRETRRAFIHVDVRSIPARDPFAEQEEAEEEEAREAVSNERCRALYCIARGMPERQHDVWYKCRIQGWSPGYVALLLGISVKTVRNYVQRGDDYMRTHATAARVLEEIARERARPVDPWDYDDEDADEDDDEDDES